MPIGAVGLVAAAGIGTAGNLVAANQSKKALEGAQGIAQNLTYQPIDIAKVQSDAAAQAASNATASLALERQLQPDVAGARAGLSKSVNDQLALGGKLPPDIANMIARSANIAGGASGGFGGTPGVTAATLGTSALGLLNQRQQNASALLAGNPLPTAGLDPGSLASLEVSQNAAQNDFNAAKAGVQTNLLNSQGQVSAAGIGGAANSLASLVGLLGKLNTGGTTTSPVPATTFQTQPGTFNYSASLPTTAGGYNASLIPGGP